MNSCRDVSTSDTYDEIYQKATDMVSTEEISICDVIVKHQTMCGQVTYEQNHLRIIISATSATHFRTV